MEGSFTAVPGSALSSMYNGQSAVPSQFASVIREDAAAYFHSATSISPETVKQTQKTIGGSLYGIRDAISNSGDLTPEQADDINTMIDRVVKLFMDSMAEGKMDLGGVLLANEESIKFVGGGFVSDGTAVAQLLKDIAAKVENEPGAPTFSFDQSTYKEVVMHLVEADLPADEEEVRKIFGEKLRVHVGTGPKAIYLAVGQDSEAELKALIDAGQNDTGSKGRPVGQLRVKLLPILEFAHSVAADDTIAAMIDALSNSDDHGEIYFMSDTVENGGVMRITVGEGILQSIGAAVSQSQVGANAF